MSYLFLQLFGFVSTWVIWTLFKIYDSDVFYL